MPRLKPPIHGRDHRQGGADPIIDPNVIRYVTRNSGLWLDVATTGADPDAGSLDPGKGIKLYSSNGILIENSDVPAGTDGRVELVVGSSEVLLDKGALAVETQGILFKFFTGLGSVIGTEFLISSSASHGDLNLYELTDGGVTTWKFYDSSSKIEVKDHTGSVIFQVLDDGTVTASGSVNATLDGGGP